MAPQPLVIAGRNLRPRRARRQLERAGVAGAPVVDDRGRFEGTVTAAGARLGRRRRASGPSRRWSTRRRPRWPLTAHLDVALDALTTSPDHWVTVLDGERQVLGTVGVTDVVRGYRLGLLSSLQDMDAGGEHDGTNRVHIDAGSPLVGPDAPRVGPADQRHRDDHPETA